MQIKILPAITFLLFFVCGTILLPANALAQFNTPVINAAAGANEYGNANINNYVTNGGNSTWYMTWDDTYLYLLLSNANASEAAVIYLDINPLIPVNGGTAANGANIGQAYDGLAAPNLPFRADAILYVKNDYREFRRWNGSEWVQVSFGVGGLGGGSDDYADGEYASDGGTNTRELRISWSRLTNGGTRPVAFNWNGYVAYNNGLYAQVPVENPGGTFPAASLLNFSRYLTTTATANGASDNPMSRNSYTHIGDNLNNFAGLNVWDFTMNTADRTISRATVSPWNIANNFVVNNGTVFFNTAAGNNTTVGGNLLVSGGLLDLDNAGNDNDLLVNGNVIFTGGTLRASNISFSDIFLKGNWQQSGTAIFDANNRSIYFDGGSQQTLSGISTFANLYLDNAAGLKLMNSITALATITIARGKMNLSGYDLTLRGVNSMIVENRTENHFITDNTAVDDANKGGRIIATSRPVTGTQTDIAGLGLLLNDATGYDVGISRYHYRADTKSMRKLYTVSGTPTATTLAIEYALEELAGIATAELSIYRRDASWNMVASAPAGNKVTANDAVTAFSDWTLADKNIPLPVSLVRFEASRLTANEVRVAWQTASEQNSMQFEVEQSKDGQQFVRVATVKAAGFSTQPRAYNSLITETKGAFYRLKNVDADGKFAYIPQVFVEAAAGVNAVRIYPNPVSNSVQILSEYPANQVVTLQVINVQGRVISSFKGNIQGIGVSLNQAVPGLTPGIYFLKFETNGQQTIERMIKM